MNRRDFQRLAKMRLEEAKVLLDARKPSGAYYLAGYSVECGLKSCIAKQVRRHQFPDRQTVNQSYKHDLDLLVGVAGLRDELAQEMKRDADFEKNWLVVKDWSEQSRYSITAQREARDMLEAVMDPQHGVMQWIMRNS